MSPLNCPIPFSANRKCCEIIATYDYTDANGKLLYQVVRYSPKSFKQRRSDGNGGWIWNLKGVEPVLYHLPEVLAGVREKRTVYICEGEKDTDALRKIGLVATTNSGGAGKWQPDNSGALRGASVVVIPDRDAPGQGHAVKVATSLHSKAKSIKVLKLPDKDSRQVKDVSNWLEAGGTMAELERLGDEAPEYRSQGGEAKHLISQPPRNIAHTKAAREDYDIVEVIEQYTELKNKGKELMGKCPFHVSRYGSNFEVNPEKQVFYCFSCGKSGDVVKFIMEMERLSVGQAIKFLKNNYHTQWGTSTNNNSTYKRHLSIWDDRHT